MKALACCLMALSVAILSAPKVSGLDLPKVVEVGSTELHLNGTGVLKEAIFFKVYEAGLYLQTPTSEARTALIADEPKRMVIEMLRDVSRQNFVQQVEKAIKRNSGQSMPALRTRLDLLEQRLPALKKGDILEFTYIPSAGTFMRCQGQEVTIRGKDFADALFAIWLGPDPVNGGLKRSLLGLP